MEVNCIGTGNSYQLLLTIYTLSIKMDNSYMPEEILKPEATAEGEQVQGEKPETEEVKTEVETEQVETPAEAPAEEASVA